MKVSNEVINSNDTNERKNKQIKHGLHSYADVFQPQLFPSSSNSEIKPCTTPHKTDIIFC